MRVGELIKELQQFDPKLEIKATDPDYRSIYHGMTNIELVVMDCWDGFRDARSLSTVVAPQHLKRKNK